VESDVRVIFSVMRTNGVVYSVRVSVFMQAYVVCTCMYVCSL